MAWLVGQGAGGDELDQLISKVVMDFGVRMTVAI
jgi:hypothetical protein